MYNDSFRKRYKAAPVAITENTAPFDTPPHIHREIEMLYIKEGKAEIFVSDRSYHATSGDMVFVNPLDVHSIKADRGCSYRQRCICFDTSLIMDTVLREELLSGEVTVSEYHRADAEKTTEISELFDSLFSSVTDNSEALFLESVAFVSMIFVNLKKAGLLFSKKDKTKRTNFVRKVQEYLSIHYSEQITSQDIAKELFYNQSYFCRLFRENYAISFLDYLTLYRISNAKLMLSSGKVRISEVAEQVGFLDASYFSRCFKKIVGVSPTEYQKGQFSHHKKSI